MGRFLSPSPSRREFYGKFFESPSLFFSRELLYDGEVFGSDLELQGIGWVKLQGYSKVTMRIKKDLTSSKMDDARSSFFVLAWDFRGCQTLPFLRGQTMLKFPKNNTGIFTSRWKWSAG